MSIKRTTPFFVTALFLCLAALPVSAQHAGSFVHVNNCNPSMNLHTTTYTPGYWGAARWWWDPYGTRFYAPASTSANAWLGIDYVNVSSKTMHTIEFGLVANGVLKAEVRDVGTFSPNAEIKHRFPLSPNVFPIGTGLPRCVPLRIAFADGTHWRNPALPHRNDHIYLHP